MFNDLLVLKMQDKIQFHYYNKSATEDLEDILVKMCKTVINESIIIEKS